MILTQKISTSEKGIFKYKYRDGFYIPIVVEGKSQLIVKPTLIDAVAFKESLEWLEKEKATQAANDKQNAIEADRNSSYEELLEWLEKEKVTEAANDKQNTIEAERRSSYLISRGIKACFTRRGLVRWDVNYGHYFIGRYAEFSLAWLARYTFLKEYGIPPFPPNKTPVPKVTRGGLYKRNTSGFRYIVRCGHQWEVKIRLNKRYYYLGRFNILEEAIIMKYLFIDKNELKVKELKRLF